MADKTATSTNKERQFEVAVEGSRANSDHINVDAETADQAFEKAKKKAQRSRYDVETPINAIEAYDTDNGVTHHP